MTAARQEFRPELVQQLHQGRSGISTLEIMEAAAVLNEVYYLRWEPLIPDDLRRTLLAQRTKEFQTERHSKVIGILCKHLGLTSELGDLPRNAYINLALLCDIALNPPLPPYVLISPRSPMELWFEVDPVSRLALAVEAAMRVAPIRDGEIKEKVEEYQRKVCEAAGLACHWDYQDPWPHHATIDLKSVPADLSFIADHDLDEYFLSLQNTLWRLRRKIPGLVAMPCAMEFADTDVDMTVLFDYSRSPEEFYLGPLVKSIGGHVEANSEVVNAARLFTLRSLTHFVLHDIFMGDHEMNIETLLPVSFEKPSWIVRTIEANIGQVFAGLTQR